MSADDKNRVEMENLAAKLCLLLGERASEGESMARLIVCLFLYAFRDKGTRGSETGVQRFFIGSVCYATIDYSYTR